MISRWPWQKKLRDHLGRDDKDFAIEFGSYLAGAAEHMLRTHEATVQAEALIGADKVDYDAIGQARNNLESAIYEFRKRAIKATASKR